MDPHNYHIQVAREQLQALKAVSIQFQKQTIPWEEDHYESHHVIVAIKYQVCFAHACPVQIPNMHHTGKPQLASYSRSD